MRRYATLRPPSSSLPLPKIAASEYVDDDPGNAFLTQARFDEAESASSAAAAARAAEVAASEAEIRAPRNPFTPLDTAPKVVDHFPAYFSAEHAIQEAQRLGIALPEVMEEPDPDAATPPPQESPPSSPLPPSFTWSPVLGRTSVADTVRSGESDQQAPNQPQLTDAEEFRELFREDEDDLETLDGDANPVRVLALPPSKQSIDTAVHELRFALDHPLSIKVSDLERKRADKAREHDAFFKAKWNPTSLDAAVGRLSLTQGEHRANPS